MNRQSNTWFLYGGMMLLCAVVFYYVIHNGLNLNVSSSTSMRAFDSHVTEKNGFFQVLWGNVVEPGSLVLLQMIIILFFARMVGFLLSKIGQPTVMGEILAGIIIGPSILGKIFPAAFSFLFTTDSLDSIYLLSQIGLILFMFIIGLELNTDALRNKMSGVFVVSQASIFIPFLIGIIIAYYIYADFASSITPFLPFALFFGISMSITALPVLARIVQEKDLTKTHLGMWSLASAAIGDVTAWCLLAIVIAISTTGSLVGSLPTLLLAFLYVSVMLLVVKPLMRKIGKIHQTTELVNKSIVAFVLLLLLISAYITQIIGIHALFGAFLAGVCMPPIANFRRILISKIEDVSVSLFLPLFFVFIGLRADIGLLNTPTLWWMAAGITFMAVCGKIGGTAVIAKMTGESWIDSISLGILMNTKGLMELIILNIGYELGYLPPVIFVILVVMTLVTTFMTSPLLSLIQKFRPDKERYDEIRRKQSLGIFNALVAVGNPVNGKILLNVAKNVLDGYKNSLSVTILHMTVGTDINQFSAEAFHEESFKSVRTEAINLGIPIETKYKVTDNLKNELVLFTNENQYDFLLIGSGASISKPDQKNGGFPNGAFFKQLKKILSSFSGSNTVFYPGLQIRDNTHYFIEHCMCSVGVFINRNFLSIEKTLILINEKEDIFLLRYGRRLIRNNSSVKLRIKDISGLCDSHEPMAQGLLNLMKEFPDSVQLCKSSIEDQSYMSGFSFMLISYPTWNHLVESGHKSLNYIPSTLIINKKKNRYIKES